MSRPLTNDELRACVRILCDALGRASWDSCRDLAEVVRDVCDESEASELVRDYLVGEIGLDFQDLPEALAKV